MTFTRRTSLITLALAAAFSTRAHAGSILISDFLNNTVTIYDANSGVFSRTLVTSGSGGLDGASGVRVGPGGNVYVASQNTNSVLRYDLSTGTFLGDFVPSGTGGLSSPQDLVFGPDGNLWVVSSANDQILRYDGATGAFLGVFATIDQPSHNGPINLRFGPDGSLYVTAFDGSRILKLDPVTGAVLATFLPPSGAPAYVGLAFGPDGSLFASALDTTDFTGSVLHSDTGSTAFLGTFVPFGTGGLISPAALGFTPSGNLMVLDVANAGILVYDGTTGAFQQQLISDPSNLPLAFFFDTVPEPSTFVLIAGAAVLLLLRR